MCREEEEEEEATAKRLEEAEEENRPLGEPSPRVRGAVEGSQGLEMSQ